MSHDPVLEVPTCFNRLSDGVGDFTTRVAVAVFPVPPSVEDTLPVVFTLAEGFGSGSVRVPTTSTENVQEELAARVAPLKLIVDEPAIAVMVPAPQLPERPFGVATTTPLGKGSLNSTPLNETNGFGLLMVKCRLVVSPEEMYAGSNTLEMTGGATTVRFAVP